MSIESLQLYMVYFTLQCVLAQRFFGNNGLIASLVGTLIYLGFF
jgi:hypothetical protein